MSNDVYFQGIKAVIAESYERIHRSNLVGMGIMPLQYQDGQTAETLGLSGKEMYNIELPTDIKTQQLLTVKVTISIIVILSSCSPVDTHYTNRCIMSCGIHFI